MPPSPAEDENLRQLLRECHACIPRDRLASVGASVAVFAHEVGNRLNNLALQAQMLERGLQSEGHPLVKRTQSLRSEINRLNELLTDFRSIDENLEREAVPIDMAELVREVVALEVRPYFRKEVTIDFETSHDLPQLFADVVDVKQIMFFLLHCASKTSPNALALRLGQGDAFLVLEMDVRGAEIDSQSNPWGLGLLLVRHRARTLGGSVRWNATEGAGATFTVRLPVTPLPQAPAL